MVVSPLSRQSVATVTFFALASAAAAAVLYGTAVAPWAYSDGIGYIANGRNLFSGPGLGIVNPSGAFEPLVSHPPLYPVLVAGFEHLGLPILSSIRFINALTFSLFVGMIGIFMARRAKSILIGGFASVLTILLPGVLLIFLGVLSEPIFLTTAFVSLFLLAEFLSSGKRGLLLGSAIACSVSVLTRYPGVTVLCTALALMLLSPIGPTREKGREAIEYALISLGPLGLFLVRNWAAGAPAPKGVSVFSVNELVAFAKQVGGVLWEWKPVPPLSVLNLFMRPSEAVAFMNGFSIILGITLIVTGGLVIRGLIRSIGREGLDFVWAHPLPFTMVVFSLIYLLMYLAAYLLADPTPDVNARTLVPILPASIISLISLSVVGLRRIQPISYSAIVSLGAGFTVLLGYGIISMDILTGLHRTGMGFTGRDWQQAEITEAIQVLPRHWALLSNAPEAVLLYADRFPYDTSVLGPVPADNPAPTLGHGDTELDRIFRASDSALILFSEELVGAPGESVTCLPPCEGRSIEGLELFYQGLDGSIIRYTDPSR